MGNPEPFEHPAIPWRFPFEQFDSSNLALVSNFEKGKKEFVNPIPVELTETLLRYYD